MHKFITFIHTLKKHIQGVFLDDGITGSGLAHGQLQICHSPLEEIPTESRQLNT